MKAPKGRKRKWLRRMLWGSGFSLAVLAAMPLWFPLALRPLLRSAGVSFGDYTRYGYSGFILTDLTAKWSTTRLKVREVRSLIPSAWLWSILVQRTGDSPLLSLDRSELVIASSPDHTQTTPASSFNRTLRDGLSAAEVMKRWLPRAELTNGRILVASNQFQFPHAEWRSGVLTMTARLPESQAEVQLRADVTGDSALEFSGRCDAYQLSAQGALTKSPTNWDLAGSLRWLTNQASCAARWGSNGWWPTQARIESAEIDLPAQSISLPGYDRLKVAFGVDLASNICHLQASGVALPQEQSVTNQLPRLGFTLAADADPVQVNLRKLDIESVWLRAQLTNSVGFKWNGELLPTEAAFHITVELDKLPAVGMAGRLDGVLRIRPRSQESPLVLFELSAADFHFRQIDIQETVASGEFNWPKLKLAELKADFTDNSVLRANGSVDLLSREVLEVNWSFNGDYLNRFFNELQLQYREFDSSGRCSGPLTNLTHVGKATVGKLLLDGCNPIDARIDWTGQGLHLSSASAEFSAGNSTLFLAGRAGLSAPNADEISATITNGFLRRRDELLYTLQSPCGVAFRSNSTNWLFGVDSFDWEGLGRGMSLDARVSWPASGEANVRMTNVTTADFADFRPADFGKLLLNELELTARWTNGPIQAALELNGAFTDRVGQTYALRTALVAADSLSIRQLSIDTGYTPTLSVTGIIPLRFEPAQVDPLRWEESAPIQLSGSWKDGRAEELSIPLGGHGSILISSPQLKFRFAGTPERPMGSVEFETGDISWVSATNVILPKLEELRLNAEINPDGIRADATAQLESLPIKAAGAWPIPAAAWQTLWDEKRLPEWDKARAKLELDRAKLAAFSRFLPTIVSPEGVVSATLELSPGKQVNGVASINNGSLRPIGQMPPLRDIAGTVRFDGNQAVLDGVQGQIGGQPILAEGQATFQEGGLDYQVHLLGTNIPLVRSLEAMLRGDVDLQLTSKKEGATLLSGQVNLHDGIYLEHASPLVWSGPQRPEIQPPYFSVTNPALADWKLDLALSGNRCLRVSTPVFKGLLSANLNLRGSLGEPLLTGVVHLNSGRVSFPFGALELGQGYASFTGDDPQGPDLRIAATGRNYGYEVRVEVNGPVENAAVSFSSTPPLTSEQILLMLTAGELPESDFAYSSSARAGRLASFLGTDLLSRFLGTDRDEEKLIFHTGESISQEGRLTYAIEYRLTDRWSIIGEYDEYNAFNTDLKCKVFER